MKNIKIMRPTPKSMAPALKFKTLAGDDWSLENQQPKNFTMIVFYRGLHCPVCKKHLKQLHELIPDFEERGVDVVAVSMDTEKRARLSRKDWELPNLTIGYGLSKESAVNWNLYLSEAVKDGEPPIFSEPGLFLIDHKQEVYYASINSNPWGRPYLPTFVKAVDYIVKSGYPARGELI